MKKIVFIALLSVFSLSTVNAQTKAKKTKKVVAAAKVVTPKAPSVEGAGMIFENETIDYGTIPHNADGKREFVFVNNGNKPLVIESTQGSCGCTVPTTPKDPIAPGAKGVIGVKYATDRVGAFEKTVTVKSNAAGKETMVIKIKGTVLPDATPAAEPTKS